MDSLILTNLCQGAFAKDNEPKTNIKSAKDTVTYTYEFRKYI